MDFRRFGACLREADLLVANDTGVLHLGAAVGIPVLALFGPTDPALWCPAAPTVKTLRAPGGDLASLPVADVERAVRGLAAHLAQGAPVPAELDPAPGPVP